MKEVSLERRKELLKEGYLLPDDGPVIESGWGPVVATDSFFELLDQSQKTAEEIQTIELRIQEQTAVLRALKEEKTEIDGQFQSVRSKLNKILRTVCPKVR